MDNSILLNTSYIFKDANLIDCIRQLSIDFESDQDSEEIQDFLNKSKKYLDEKLPDNTLVELVSAILSCFRHFPDVSIPFIEEFLQKTKLNANYIILTSMLLSSLTYEHPELKLPDYQSFILSSLNEILPQLQNESKLVIFSHEIPIQFKNDLILSLLLCTNLTENLIYDFFPYLFSTNLSKKNQKFSILIQKVLDSNLSKILPQTEESKNELFEFITNKDFNLISKMKKESLSLIQNSILFTKSGGKSDTIGLTKETVLPFISIILLFIKEYQDDVTFSESKLNGLFLEGIHFLKNNTSPDMTASIDLILENYLTLYSRKIISPEQSVRILDILIGQLLKGQYLANKTVLVFTIFDLSNQQHFDLISSKMTEYINRNGSDILNYILRNSSEFFKSEGFRINLSLFESVLINSFIQNSEDICQTLSFLNNFCYCNGKPTVSFTEEMSLFLKNQIQIKLKEDKIDDALLIAKFMDINSFLRDSKDIEEMNLPEKIKQTLTFSSQKSDASIDGILSHILSMTHPEKNDGLIQVLFDKMNEDEELLNIYLSFLVFKYAFSYFDLIDFLRYYLKEFEKYGEKFIKAVKQVYHLAYYCSKSNRALVRDNDFSVYSLPISDFGSSIVTKLFNSIDEKKDNYQAFFCLKSIANSFPLLFYNRHQELFDHIFPALNDFNLCFEKGLNLEMGNKARTAYSAFSLLLSSFQLPVIIDHFFSLISEDITKYTNPQIACFINAISFVTSDSILKLIFYPVYKKNNFLNWIGKALERDVKNNLFGMWYKESIYSLVSHIYTVLYGLNANIRIQNEEISKFENTIGDFYDKIFSTFLTNYFDNSIQIRGCNHFIELYSLDVEKKRRFWLIFNHQNANNIVTVEKENRFVEMMNVDINNSPNFDYPRGPNSYTIKMVRFLVSQSVSIYSYYLFNTQIPLYESMYNKLNEVNDKLYQLLSEKNDDDDDDVPVSNYDAYEFNMYYYCQSSLLSNLIRSVNESFLNQNYFSSDLCISIGEMSNYPITFLSILEFISQNLNEIHSNDLLFESIDSSIKVKKYIRIIDSIHNNRYFVNNFIDMCGNTLIDIALSPQWRRDQQILLNVAFLFADSDYVLLPDRITQLVSFCLMSNDKRVIDAAFKICSYLNKDQQSLIEESILKFFDAHYLDESFTLEVINKVIKIIPSIVVLKRPNFVEIVNKKLDCYKNSANKNRNELIVIGSLLNKLSPERYNSMSTINVIKESSIPSKIRETSPPFWDMFEKHSSVILEEIDKEPMLLDDFSFLLRFPELVSFSTRSSYFRKKMANSIKYFNNYFFKVDRSNLLETSIRAILGNTRNQLMREFNIEYIGESGRDERGITRDWFSSVAKELFNQNLGLFECSLNKMSYKPSNKSTSIPNYLDYFRFAGILIARALVQGICIDIHLTTFVLKQILHRQPNLNDIQDYDVDVYNSLKTIEECEDIDSLDLVFAIDRLENGVVKTIPLKPNGEEILVTKENLNEFINLRVNYICKNEIEEQIKSLVNGFDSLISHREIRIFTPNELDLLICGIPEIDIEDFKKNVDYGIPYDDKHHIIVMFFNVISKWNAEQKARLLFFMTGSSRVPANGFKEFCQMCGKPLLIAPGGDRTKLPQAHTCNNMLCLPEYQNEEEMNDKLLFAIYNVNGFELI